MYISLRLGLTAERCTGRVKLAIPEGQRAKRSSISSLRCAAQGGRAGGGGGGILTSCPTKQTTPHLESPAESCALLTFYLVLFRFPGSPFCAHFATRGVFDSSHRDGIRSLEISFANSPRPGKPARSGRRGERRRDRERGRSVRKSFSIASIARTDLEPPAHGVGSGPRGR